ncbi:MAG: hypothetical protein KJ556_21425, partial [Gammaproteobacteria bacterium]|nr:hypothetical protein [Gammaproteobacteria bacterium]
ATDVDSALTNAVTEATAFVNTWTSRNYLEWEAYSTQAEEGAGASSSSSSSSTSGDGSRADDTTYTINAPNEIARICLQVSKIMYWQGQGHISRDGEEDEKLEGRLEYYRQLLEKIEISPVKKDVTISLDTNGCQLIGRNLNIIPWNSYVVSASTNMWNQGEHWTIRKGGTYDDEYYDGWYFDASNYTDTMEGTLYYWRSYRKDTKDYMRFVKEDWNTN